MQEKLGSIGLAFKRESASLSFDPAQKAGYRLIMASKIKSLSAAPNSKTVSMAFETLGRNTSFDLDIWTGFASITAFASKSRLTDRYQC
jgi:hypothetical protein